MSIKVSFRMGQQKMDKFVTEIQLEIFLNLFNLIKNNVITIKVMLFKYKNMNLNFGNCEYFLLYHKLLKKIPHSGRDVPDGTRNCDIDFASKKLFNLKVAILYD